MRSPFEQAIEIDLSLQLPSLYFLESPVLTIIIAKKIFGSRWFSLVFLITYRTEEGKLPLGYLQNLRQMLRDSRIDQAVKFKQIMKYVQDLNE